MLDGGFEGTTNAFTLLEIKSRNTFQVFYLWLYSQPYNQSTLRAIFYLQQVVILSTGEPPIMSTLHKLLTLLAENAERGCRFWRKRHGLQSVNILLIFPWCRGWDFCCHPRLRHWLLSRECTGRAWLRSTLQEVCSPSCTAQQVCSGTAPGNQACHNGNLCWGVGAVYHWG